ncbi:hypothetical protein D3C86_1426670 [compost metagenome]
MNDKRLAPRIGNRTDKIADKIVVFDRIDTDPMLDRHRNGHRIAHRLDAICHQGWLRHQASAKSTTLHALRRATAVEVDFLVAPLFAEFCSLGKVRGLATAQLQRHGLLGGVEVKVPRHIAMEQCASRHHLGIQPGVPAQRTVKGAAMAVSPIHHRGNRDAAGICGHADLGIADGAWGQSPAIGRPAVYVVCGASTGDAPAAHAAAEQQKTAPESAIFCCS